MSSLIPILSFRLNGLTILILRRPHALFAAEPEDVFGLDVVEFIPAHYFAEILQPILSLLDVLEFLVGLHEGEDDCQILWLQLLDGFEDGDYVLLLGIVGPDIRLEARDREVHRLPDRVLLRVLEAGDPLD